ncbi:MAG: metal ABC transporter ATP-binding protein [Oligoflexia bacterium]|nr:metal ABC transporter ATP-binding protein [Oligoflexia bacterium]
MPAVEVHDLTVAYRQRPVLWDIDFSIPEGCLAAVVGPNGAGKSTLLKAVMGLLPSTSGYVNIFGEPVLNKRSIIAYVPQREEVDWDFPITVQEVVMMGRTGRLPFWRRVSTHDRNMVEQALTEVGIFDLKHRHISELSGGQQQRVFIARALAQDAAIYLMDEPFAGVDAATEKAVIELFRKLKAARKTVICVHHDLHTLADYFDYVVLVNLRLVAAGQTSATLTPENLNKTYGGRLGLLSEITERVRKRQVDM